MKPSTEEAVPATWPSGSIASALKFVPMKPNRQKFSVMIGTKNHSGAAPPIA